MLKDKIGIQVGAGNKSPLWIRVAWLIAIWALSVLALGAVAFVIRQFMFAAGMSI